MIALQILLYIVAAFMLVVVVNVAFDLRLFRKVFAKIALRRIKKKAQKLAKENGETIYVD